MSFIIQGNLEKKGWEVDKMENETEREKIMTMEDIEKEDDTPQKSWITLEKGKTKGIEIKEIKWVKDEEYHLSGIEKKVVIETKTGKSMSITAWVLWNLVKEAVKKNGQIEGTKLQIYRSDRDGVYVVKYFKDGNWHPVEAQKIPDINPDEVK